MVNGGPREGQGCVADGPRCQCVGERGNARQGYDVSGRDAHAHAGRAGRLDADDGGTGVALFDGSGDARDESAAADSDDEEVCIWYIGAEFDCHGALAGNRLDCLERMDVWDSLGISVGHGGNVGVVPDVPVAHHGRTPGFDTGDAVGRGAGRQINRRRATQAPRGICKRNPVVAARG